MVDIFSQQPDDLNFNLTKSLTGKLCVTELQAPGIYTFIVDAFKDTKLIILAIFVLCL